MSERFEKLWTLPGAFCTSGAPVLIEAGSLLRDTQSGRVLAQLKLKNISAKQIKAVTVRITPLDTVMQPLGESEIHQLLDLSAARDENFGQKTAIYLKNTAVRAYRVAVQWVAFWDNSTWEADSAEWQHLPKQKAADDFFENAELVKQYRIEYGESMDYIADEMFGLWRCGCGSFNTANESECHSCGMQKSALLSLDRARLEANCAARLEQERQAAEAARIAAEKKAEEMRIVAEKAKKRAAKTAAVIAIIAVAAVAAYLLIFQVIVPKIRYNAQMDGLQNAAVGESIKFGFYEQDNNTLNGKEEIEWLVLAVEDNKALVISKYALDCQKYNSASENITWEECDLRDWLNSNFLNEAFSARHQNMIAEASVPADKNPKYSTDPGNATTDQVFLLSIIEAEEYFTSKCKPTKYAVANGAYVNSGNGMCWWWLRSPGRGQNYAACAMSEGWINCGGSNIDFAHGCVRPAMWIDLGA